MKVITCILVLLPFAFGNPVPEETERMYVPEENDPYYKRFIPMEKENGEIEIVDLLAIEGSTIEPFVSTSDVEFDLYTRSNINSPVTIKNNNVGTLSSSAFDPNKLSVFVAHGWTNSRSSEINRDIRSGIWAGGYDVNLFVVDWSKISRKDYISAKNSVVGVGQVIGSFINAIQSRYGLNGNSFVLIGHSLGAHVMGGAGASINSKVRLIIGLDPAGPLFTILNTRERLDKSDAQLVEVMHTDGGGLGFLTSIGHIDYYPNGGMSQPGCPVDVTGLCAHMRAYKYLAEALQRGNVFLGRKCSSYTSYNLGLCLTNERSVMGALLGSGNSEGDYYLKTNSRSPYGQS